MKRLACCSVAAAIYGALSVGALPARADVKIFPASVCDFPIPAFAALGGAVSNPSLTVSVNITCPLDRDNPTVKPTKIEVSVVDNSSPLVGEKNVRCRAFTANRFGLALSAGAFASTVGTNSAGTILNLPIPAATNADGPLTVHCIIPRRGTGDPNSFVGSIKLTEPTAAGD